MEEAVIVDASNQSGKLHDVAPHKHTTRLERQLYVRVTSCSAHIQHDKGLWGRWSFACICVTVPLATCLPCGRCRSGTVSARAVGRHAARPIISFRPNEIIKQAFLKTATATDTWMLTQTRPNHWSNRVNLQWACDVLTQPQPHVGMLSACVLNVSARSASAASPQHCKAAMCTLPGQRQPTLPALIGDLHTEKKHVCKSHPADCLLAKSLTSLVLKRALDSFNIQQTKKQVTPQLNWKIPTDVIISDSKKEIHATHCQIAKLAVVWMRHQGQLLPSAIHYWASSDPQTKTREFASYWPTSLRPLLVWGSQDVT